MFTDIGLCIKQIAWPVGHDSGALAVCLPCDLDRGATLCRAIVAFQVQGKHRVDALGYYCLTLVALLFVHWLVLVQNVNVNAWGVWVIKFVYNCALYNILRYKGSTQLWPDFFFQINIPVCWFFLSYVSNWLWISFMQKYIANILPPFKIVKCLGFSICKVFAMHLYVQCISRNKVKWII
jgi:hypothetical protein